MIKPELLVPQVNTVGLVAHYKLWAGLTTAGEVFDYSLGGATGTVTGTDIAPTYPGFSFNGTDDFIDVGNQGGAIKTIGLWMLSPNVTLVSYLIDLNGTGYITIDGAEVDPSGFAASKIYVDGVEAVAVTNDTWHLVGLTIGAAETASDLDIGRVEGLGLFTGKIGDVMLFDRVLSAADMKSIYEVTRGRYGV
ncbi:hypothetical protein LCGC14_1258650 [marine sediment metagenome]|uniref:LamG-like jellyroll fold domain-containing protein n=1 Tax=marine sediment metagenome TaxID=412755 RepID=A0A0F9P4Q6_9ZZZZ